MSVGESDFWVPEPALRAGWKAMEKGETHFACTNGIPELLEALEQKAYCDYGLEYDPYNEIIVTVGGTQAISSAPTSC